MAQFSQLSDQIRMDTALKRIDYANDIFKMILMSSGFTFDPSTHLFYLDVSASELSTGNGYTAGGALMAGVAVTLNVPLHRAEITWSNVTWTASGGPIGPTSGAIIYDDTTSSDSIVGYIDFDGAQTEPAGGVATIANPIVRL